MVDLSSSYHVVDKSVVFAFLFIPIVFDAHVGRLDPWLSARKDSVQQFVYVRSYNSLSMLTEECVFFPFDKSELCFFTLISVSCVFFTLISVSCVFFHLDKSEGSVFMCSVEPLDRRDHTAVVYLAVEENLG